MTDAGGSARRHRWLKWFWIANLPVALAMILWLPPKVTFLYISLVSVYANIVSHAGAEQACEARVAVEDIDS